MKSVVTAAAILLLLVLGIAIGVLYLLRDKRPPIYFAAAEGDTNYVAVYLRTNEINQPIVCYKAGRRVAPLLSIAAIHGQVTVVDFLLAEGADPNQRDRTDGGDTPLLHAIGAVTSPENRATIVKRLITAGADPNKASTYEYQATPLMKASFLGEEECVALLLSNGADPNATNKIGDSALHDCKKASIAEKLLSAGARTDIRNQAGETPADTARRLQHNEVLELLEGEAKGRN